VKVKEIILELLISNELEDKLLDIFETKAIPDQKRKIHILSYV